MMTQAPSRTTVLLVVAAFLVAASPHLLAMPIWLALAIVGAGAWRALIALLGLRRPGWLVRSAMTFGGLALVIAHYGTLWGRRAATVLLCVMVAAKLSEMFRLRDARVVAALGYFLIATQFLFSQELMLFGYLLAGCALVTASLVHIQRDADGLSGASAGQSLGRLSMLRLARDGFVLMAMAVPFALVLFTLFPRLASPLWGMPENALDARTGLSDQMSPGSIADLYIDDSPAFRVEFDGLVPQRDQLYWRGPVLWRFDGRTWGRLFSASRPPKQTPRPGPGAHAYTVQLEPTERRWLFALDYPVRSPPETGLSPDFELIRDRPVTSLMSYDMISQPNFRDAPDLSQTLRRLALHLPEGSNPRTRQRARELRQRYPDDQALIDAVLQWFNREEFFYSLQAAPLGRNGADEFLFDLRVGYCEYYASAFAVLMRAAGIPTRIVTGYQGGLWQPSDNYLLIRQSDAHAWTEVWLQGRGWTRVDPTAAVAPSRIDQGARSAVSGSGRWPGAEWLYELRNQYDRLQNVWNKWVLGFDAERQRNFLERIGLDALGAGARAALLVALAGLVLVPLAFLFQGIGRLAPKTGRLDRAWQRLCKRLKRAGVSTRPGETPLELAARASATLANADELLTLAKKYSELKYGPMGEDTDIDEFIADAAAWQPIRLNPGHLSQSYQ